jgi:hypothetical protein
MAAAARPGGSAMSNDRERTGDWDRSRWPGDAPDHDRTPDAPAEGTDAGPGETARWQKTQWPGDQGSGDMPREDPDTFPEGETGLSGDRHAPSEQHWARGQSSDPS